LLDKLIDFFTEADIPYDDNGNTVLVSAYAGVFNIPEGFAMRSPSDIMSRIMYTEETARNGSQGSIVFCSEIIMEGKERAKRIHKMLPKSLKMGEICAFFQPKVNINTGELVGAEALCRWFHDGKMIPPNRFIPVLEATNEICQLDFYILELVCKYIRKWLDEGKKVVRISVNLSRRHMTNPDLLDTLIDIIDRYNVPHEYIEIELVETTTDVEFKDLKRVVEGLQAQNINTSVDDFGMGYSSLNLLRIVPWNTMKIDRIFLPEDDEADSSKRSTMFGFIVALASELGFECIAEGVETTAQLELLRECHCELAQGYLFDKPLPVEEFEKRLDIERYDVMFDT
jgi:EAL domain-containing protein (putative c-di-GMP-specific phosphodiesterase class I)